MREGGRLYCRCNGQTCKVCVDQRPASTEATCTGPCSAPPQTTKTHRKEGRLHCLLWCLQETEHQRRKRENKKMLRKEKEDEVVCEDKERNED